MKTVILCLLRQSTFFWRICVLFVHSRMDLITRGDRVLDDILAGYVQ